jgi:hypothetical protein
MATCCYCHGSEAERQSGLVSWVRRALAKQTKARYKFPYGDFAKVHRCELLAAEVRAGRLKYRGIEDAAIRLRDMIDEMAH